MTLTQRMEYLNCNFSLAVTLCHEMAHVTTAYPYFRYVSGECKFPGEVFHSTQEMILRPDGPPEAGFSWERSIFSGQKAPQP